jgi:hypothetical protein
MPSAADEKATYTKWGWTWTASKEPAAVTEPIRTYSVGGGIDVHNETEGDDLWTYLMMYRRSGPPGGTGNPVYLNRANAWLTYFKSGAYRADLGRGDDGFEWDHMYGRGLIAWYQHTCDLNACDTQALTEAENLGAIVETLMNQAKWTPGRNMSNFGLRQSARHLLLATLLAEATQKPRWIALRDKLINLWMASRDWDARGMYFVGADQTDFVLGAGKWAAGIRIQSAFQIGVLAEAFHHVVRTTNRLDVRDKLVAMAFFIDRFGLDPQFQYTGSWFGVKADGSAFHNYNSGGTVSFWDPVYTTSLVNTLVMGYKYSGDRALYDRAKVFFNRGTKGIFGSPTQRSAADGVVHHFVDTVFDTSTSNFYLAFNKGELQYTYLLFENGGL